ncbi:MAG: response regulator [Candidatus Omnitrophica bacterium]|nr:response regulator [Candidatus Omnitrophota bacterium]MBU1997137.1 response regulator [Candidatus Omnitrophota bacterium]MBU4334648.1 response regulator [Candidatus Omnitrophota bacterium]
MNKNIKKDFSRPLDVIIVEDNQVDARILESMLMDPPAIAKTLKIANTLSSAIKILEENEIEIAILDLNLPDSKGVETIVEISNRFPKLTIVINTGAYEDELGLEALSLGAQDFLLKGKYNSYVLNKILRYCLERKRSEIELKQAYETLKETQSQLIQSEKMKVVGGLASGVAHEVKNPLATILYGVTYLIDQVKLDDDNYNLVLKNIREATDRANVIITGLLDFSTLNKFNKVEYDIVDVVEKSLLLVNYQIDKNIINVVKDYENNLAPLLIDVIRIEQVLVNILLNAIVSMDKSGRVLIKIYSSVISKNKKELPASDKDNFIAGQKVVIVEIDDVGNGIPDDEINNIFDPFYTSRRGIGGVGLGLSVSKNILENHGASIVIKNKVDAGVIAKLIFKT